MIEFAVRGEPRPQPRGRAFAVKVKGTGGDTGIPAKYTARVFSDSTAEGWKGLIARAAEQHIPRVPLDGPLAMSVEFFFSRPKKLTTRNASVDPIPYASRGRNDFDNLAKAITDCMTQLGFWQDDGQLADVHVRKFYVAIGAHPGALVHVARLTVETAATGSLFEKATG